MHPVLISFFVFFAIVFFVYCLCYSFRLVDGEKEFSAVYKLIFFVLIVLALSALRCYTIFTLR